MLDLLKDNIPKALLPLTVIVIGFIIVAISFFITRLLVKFLSKTGLLKEKDVKTTQSENNNDLNDKNN